MKKLFYALALAGIVGSASIGTATAITHSKVIMKGGGDEKKKKDADTLAAYKCPMKCEGEKTYDKAGKCPKCGMDLSDVKKATVSEHKCSDMKKGKCSKKCSSSESHGKKSSCPDGKTSSPSGTEKK